MYVLLTGSVFKAGSFGNTIELKVQIAIVCLPGVVGSMQILFSLDTLYME